MSCRAIDGVQVAVVLELREGGFGLLKGAQHGLGGGSVVGGVWRLCLVLQIRVSTQKARAGRSVF